MERGQITLLDQPALIQDLIALPDGSILIAGPSNTSVSLSPPSRQSLDTLYTSATSFSLIQTATGAAFGSGGGLARAFIGDARLGSAQLLDLNTDEIVWSTSLGIPGSGADIVRLVTMPGLRLAAAMNWAGVGVQGVDVLPTPGSSATRIRFASAEHEGQPTDTTIINEIDTLRDLAALDEDTLLLTTKTSLLAVAISSRAVVWRVDLGDDSVGEPLTGELASARPLASGLIAAATFQPGVWTQPHPSHRVHWISIASGAPVVVARSTPLQRAPRRIAAAASTGGTGTLGYTAGQTSGSPGELEDLELVTVITIEPDSARVGDTLTSRVSLRNPSELSVPFGALQIRATPGRTCISASDDDLVIAQTDAGSLPPGTITTVQGEVEVDSTYADGSWCAYVALVDLDGSSIRLPTETNFTVDGAPARAPVEELDFSRAGQDAGAADAGDAGSFNIPIFADPQGCGCRSTRAPYPASPLLLLALGALGALLWRRP